MNIAGIAETSAANSIQEAVIGTSLGYKRYREGVHGKRDAKADGVEIKFVIHKSVLFFVDVGADVYYTTRPLRLSRESRRNSHFAL